MEGIDYDAPLKLQIENYLLKREQMWKIYASDLKMLPDTYDIYKRLIVKAFLVDPKELGPAYILEALYRLGYRVHLISDVEHGWGIAEREYLKQSERILECTAMVPVENFKKSIQAAVIYYVKSIQEIEDIRKNGRTKE